MIHSTTSPFSNPHVRKLIDICNLTSIHLKKPEGTSARIEKTAGLIIAPSHVTHRRLP